MSVQSETSRVQYIGNGSTETPYPVPFYFIKASHLKVVVTDSDGAENELSLGGGFKATGAGGVSGNVTTVTAVESTQKLTIYREVPALQQTDLEENDKLPAKAIEMALDSVVMIAQQISRKIGRCLRVSDASGELSPFQASSLTENSVPVVGDDGALHLWSIQKLAEELSWTAAIPAALNYLQILYPVGCVYITQRSENPRDTFGFGTWVRFGAGRMLMALDPSNPLYATVGNTGGEYAHTLTESELPKHVHIIASVGGTAASGGGHTHVTGSVSGTATMAGLHDHRVNIKVSYLSASAGAQGIMTAGDDSNFINSGSNPGHTHVVTIPSFNITGGTHAHDVTIPQHQTNITGEDEAHNNLPPYIVVNMWTRIVSDRPELGVGEIPFPADPTRFIDKVSGDIIELQFHDGVPKYVNLTHPEE